MSGKYSLGFAPAARASSFVAALLCAAVLLLCTPAPALAAEGSEGAHSATGASVASSQVVSVEALPKVVKPGGEAYLEVQAAPGASITTVWVDSTDGRFSWKLEAYPVDDDKFKCEINPPWDAPWPDMWIVTRACFVDAYGVEGEVWNEAYRERPQAKPAIDMRPANFAIYLRTDLSPMSSIS